MSDSTKAGEVITFYSYKGGTGRTMALANVACLLARQAGGDGVLAIDWDLEAPGLHRYFHGHLSSASNPGLIELLEKLKQLTSAFPEGVEEPSDVADKTLRDSLSLDEYVIGSGIESLSFMKAGRFDPDYPTRVNTFGWEHFFERSPWALPWLLQWLTEKYRYVLIDSRTGVTDTSGICSALLPEKLVVVFTPNRQSLEGAVETVRRAVTYRAASDDLRPLRVFPLPSRVEPARPNLQAHWRSDPNVGYQPTFEALFAEQYGLEVCKLGPYFDDVQIQHVPDYAYGEEIAVLAEAGDRLSLARSYETFVNRLTSSANAWDTEARDYDARKVAMAAAHVIQSISLEFHVGGFTRKEGVPADQGRRAFGDGTVLTPDQFQRIRGDTEWVVRHWVEEDLMPLWQQHRARLADARVPLITNDTSLGMLFPVVAMHVSSIVSAAAAERDVLCELRIANGWSAWEKLYQAQDQAGLLAKRMADAFDDAGVRLSGPLSAFAAVVHRLEREFGRLGSTLDSLDNREPHGLDAGTRQACLDPATVLQGCWRGLLFEQRKLFERALERSDLKGGSALTVRQFQTLAECDFLRWMAQRVTPAWREARNEYRDLGFDVSPSADFTEFVSFHLSIVSRLLHEGHRNLGDFMHESGFSIDGESWNIVGMDTKRLLGLATPRDPDDVRLAGAFDAFIEVFDDASRQLMSALRRMQQR